MFKKEESVETQGWGDVMVVKAYKLHQREVPSLIYLQFQPLSCTPSHVSLFPFLLASWNEGEKENLF